MHLEHILKFNSGRFRLLYLLALAQLVGGPLILLHITLLAKLTVREAPEVGVIQAAADAWASPAFQESLATAALPQKGEPKPGKTEGKWKPKPDFPTTPAFPWDTKPQQHAELTAVCGTPAYLRTWTPLWPHAPPGPPPRIG